MAPAPGAKILFIGDSITDSERARPVGEGLFNAYGNGYVNQVNAILGSQYPERRYRVVNMGIGGNTVRDLAARWQTDVIDLKPDWLSVMIGVNDVWRQFDMPLVPEAAVPLEEYATTLRRLVVETQPKVAGLVLMTPFFLEPNRADPMRARLDQYGEVVKGIAAEFGLPVVDTQAAFDRLLVHTYSAAIGWDRVHVNTVGAHLIAEEWVRTVLAEAGRG